MSKIYAGIDIGSRTVKLVLLQDGQIIEKRMTENSFNTVELCSKLLEGIQYDYITATGYGRHLFAEHFRTEVISEIKAFATGVHHLYPGCRTILDIGGQDTKAISTDEKGKIRKFEMNDKCAAGTGKFLEIMSMALRYTLQEFGEKALRAEKAEKISSMCTVFAESEVVTLIAQGKSRENVAKGILQSVINRSVAQIRRVGLENDIVFVGGVALNPCMKDLLEKTLCHPVIVPSDPRVVGALGCALCGTER